MTSTIYQAVRKASLEFASEIDWQRPFAASLTLKTAYYENHVRVPLTRIDASQNLHHFLNLLNRKIYSTAERRRGANIKCVGTIEDGGVRPHFHLCLDRPAHISDEQFCALVMTCWHRTRFGYTQVDIKPCTDVDGWLRYIAKYKTKTDYLDAIDWMNVHTGSAV